MKKFSFFAVLIFSILFAPLFVASCSNSSGGSGASEDGFVQKISGRLDLPAGARPSFLTKNSFSAQIDRTAIASITEQIVYTITASSAGKDDVVTQATVSGDDTLIFEIGLSLGEWTISATGSLESDESKVCLKSEEDATISITREQPTQSVELLLCPIVEGTGNVNVAMDVGSNSGIKRVEYASDDGTTFVGSANVSSSSPFVLSQSGVPAGSYIVTFRFFDKEDSGGNLVYLAVQSIQIFQNLTTDLWSGDAPYFTEDGGFEITKSLSDTFAQTTLFVGGDDAEDTPGDIGLETRGSYFTPLASLSRAISKVKFLNSEYILQNPAAPLVPYTVVLKGQLIGQGEVGINEKINLTISGTEHHLLSFSAITLNHSDATLTLMNVKLLGDVQYDAGTLCLDGGVTLSNSVNTLIPGKIILNNPGLFITVGDLTARDTSSPTKPAVVANVQPYESPAVAGTVILKAKEGRAAGPSITNEDCGRFLCDSDYFVVAKRATTPATGILAASGGAIVPVPVRPNVTLKAYQKKGADSWALLSNLSKGYAYEIKVSAFLDGEEISAEKLSSPKINITSADSIGKEKTESSIQTESIWPAGNYNLYYQVTYDGYTFSATWNFNIQ